MKQIVRLFLIAFGLVIYSETQAQDGPVEVYGEGDQLFGINYSIGIPDAEFREFIEEASFRGFNLEYDVFIIDNLSVGFNAGYSLFHQVKERDTYTFERGDAGIAISAKIWKYTHLVPLHATFRYYYAPTFDSWVHLFGGMGLGTTYVNQELWIGLTTIQDDYWKFSFSPEFGLDIATGGMSNIQISGQYQYILNGQQDEDKLTNYNIRIGYKKWIR